MHSLLRRQVKYFFGNEQAVPTQLQGFVDAVDAAYRQSDVDRGMMERSLELSSQELMQANSEMRSLFAAMDDLIIAFDARGRYLKIVETNPSLLFKPPRELLGKTLHDILPKHKADVFVHHIGQALLTGKPESFEYSILLHGDTVWFDGTISPLSENSVLWVARDITRRKQAENQFRLLAHAVTSTKDCISIADLQNNLIFVNEAFCKVYGYSREEIVGKKVSVLHAASVRPEEVEQIFRETLAGSWYGEVMNCGKDGSEFLIELWTSIVRDESGETIATVGVARDITERKKTEEEKKSLQRQLFQAQKLESIGTLAGGIAHDFNNILGIIIGYASFIQPGDLDRITLSASTGAITKAAQRGANLVRQILTFARKTDAALEPVNVNTIIEELSEMVRETFPRTTEIALQLDKTVPVITTDHTQLHQALLNLCVNARDAMNDPSETRVKVGTLSIETEMIGGDTVRALFADATESQYVCISVSDTGIGMDEATKRRIFEPFFTTKDLGRGTGLGLAVVYGVVKRNQGFVDVESEVGRGTTFRLYLPIPASIIGLTVIEEKKSAGVTGGGTETILLVEDEESLLDLMKTALENKGYRVVTAQDGIEAIRVYTQYQESIALVLTDMGLPKLDGQGVVTALVSMNPQLSIIVASGFLDPDVQSELSKAGVKEFVDKPYAFANMLTKIREVIERAGTP